VRSLLSGKFRRKGIDFDVLQPNKTYAPIPQLLTYPLQLRNPLAGGGEFSFEFSNTRSSSSGVTVEDNLVVSACDFHLSASGPAASALLIAAIAFGEQKHSSSFSCLLTFRLA